MYSFIWQKIFGFNLEIPHAFIYDGIFNKTLHHIFNNNYKKEIYFSFD